MRSHPWEATSLGPPTYWPQSLKMAVRIMLTSRQPIWIGWGRELSISTTIRISRSSAASILGRWARPTREVWREIWDDIGPMLDTAIGGDQGTYVEAQLLIMERNGYPEETYYTFSYSPIPNDDGTSAASFAPTATTHSASSANANSPCCATWRRTPRMPATGRRRASGAPALGENAARPARSP